MHLEALRFPITPLFVLIHFDVPYFAGVTDAYSFTISGRVRAPMTVTLGELKARPTVRQPTIMECAGVGRSVAHPRAIYVPWQYEPMGVYEYTGTPLRPLLEEAGLLDDAVEVVFTGHDEGIDLGVRHNFERALPVKEALADGVLLAWEANGQALLPHHGFPLRLIVPTWYGMTSVKYLKSITVIDHTFQGEEQKQVYRDTFSSSDGGRPTSPTRSRATGSSPAAPRCSRARRGRARGRSSGSRSAPTTGRPGGPPPCSRRSRRSPGRRGPSPGTCAGAASTSSRRARWTPPATSSRSGPSGTCRAWPRTASSASA